MGLLDTEKYLRERATSGDPHGVKLRQAIREAGDAECALCRLLEDEERARLHWLAYEGLADAALRKRLRASRGFCPRHARMLWDVVAGQTRNLSAIAQIQADLTADDAAALRDTRTGGGRKGRASFRRLVGALQPTAPCPACEAAAETSARKTAMFAAALEDAAVRAEYAAGRGSLCRPHLLAVLETCASAGAASSLLDRHAAELERDAADLAELLRKTDHRFAHEPKGAEQAAPLRSLRRFIGTRLP